jgi:RNA polymerase sigma factor (sigma-70 family)
VEASALRGPAGLTRLALPSALLRLRSDEQLVGLFRQGSDEAFRVIHDRYRARLFAYTRQMLGGSRSDAEDALQDVFLRAYNALRADERPVVLKAWLYRVAHNRCIDHLRRPIPPSAEIFDVSRTPTPDPLAEAERRDDLRRLIADVQRLPDQQRSALLMREMEGLSYADVAQALDTSIPAVKSLLVRARIGLVEAAEARNTACVDIRDDLALSFGKGVRASARARKHMRECKACSEYRRDLRTVQNGLASLNPTASLGLIAKLLGLGASGGGAAAGASGAAGGGAAAVSGGVVAGATAKVAAVVCCAAITAGSAVEIKKHTGPAHRGTTHSQVADAPSAAPVARAAVAAPTATVRPVRAATRGATGAAAHARAAHARAADAARKRKRAAAAAPAVALGDEEPISPHVAETSDVVSPSADTGSYAPPTGGALAPDEPAAAPDATTDPPRSGDVTAPPTQQAGAPTATEQSGTPPASDQVSSEPAPESSPTASSASADAGTPPSGN